MLAANYDITLDRAAEYTFVLTIQDQAGIAVDLTAVADSTNPDLVWADVRDADTKKTVVEFDCEVLAPFTDGQIQLTLTEDDTLLLNAKRSYEYDIFMERSGKMERLIYGSLTVRPNYTKGVPVDPTSP
jgi:hypothetical protein